MAGIIPPPPNEKLEESINWRNWFLSVYNSRFSFKNIDAQVPTTSSGSGVTGEIRVDASYIYICITTNTWRRIAIPATTW